MGISPRRSYNRVEPFVLSRISRIFLLFFKPLHLIYRKTLNSVIFGIATMVMVGLYVAIGSGMPSVRAYFEMNDLEFFNAWPLKVLMGLLIVNLTVVTWTRIPFTPPRYGVWCIHSGIIILVLGM